MPAGESVLHQQVHTLYSDHHRWLQGWLRAKPGNAADAFRPHPDTFLRVLTTQHKAGRPLGLREPRAYLTTVLTTVARRLLLNANMTSANLSPCLLPQAATGAPGAPSAVATARSPTCTRNDSMFVDAASDPARRSQQCAGRGLLGCERFRSAYSQQSAHAQGVGDVRFLKTGGAMGRGKRRLRRPTYH